MSDRCDSAAEGEGCVPAQPNLHLAPEEVRLGHVYTMVKAMQRKRATPEDPIYADCQAILDFIAKR